MRDTGLVCAYELGCISDILPLNRRSRLKRDLQLSPQISEVLETLELSSLRSQLQYLHE
jgi:hypothetical protein